MVNRIELSQEERREMTPFELAAHEGDLEKLPELGTLSCEEGFRLFWYASRAGQIEVIKILIKKREGQLAINFAQIYRGDTALHAAARKAQIAVIKYILETSKIFWLPASSSRMELSVNILNEKKQTPLHVVSAEKDSISEDLRIEAVQYLIDSGAFPDLLDSEGITARSIWETRGWTIPCKLPFSRVLIQSIATGNLEEFLKSFEEFPEQASYYSAFHVYNLDPFCGIVLSLASFNTKKIMAEKLVEKWSITPRALFFAAKRGEDRLVRLFLGSGADATKTDFRKKIPLHEAATAEIVRILAPLSNIEARDSEQRTPLHVAVRRGRMGATRALLEMKANPNARDSRNNTPLHFARSAECAELLLEEGALLDAQNNVEQTPLHSAIDRESNRDLARGDTEVISFLLQKNPDLTLQARVLIPYDKQNLIEQKVTPLELARYRLKSARDPEIIETLTKIVQLLESAQPEQSSCLIS